MKTNNNKMSFMEAKARLLEVITKHMGPEHAIGADTLYTAVFGDSVGNKINDTRPLRILITMLRKNGVAIGARTNSNGGGYYLIRTGDELEKYRSKMYRRPALRKLAIDAKLGKVALPDLLGQIHLKLTQRTMGEDHEKEAI